ncbi:hypothetical protein ACIRN4_16275 [Pimelobacter simplex]|uniref:hypothetical protein n=1 Tax=Nocardioides simplex TaxID=2045 RepID=UPI003806AC04
MTARHPGRVSILALLPPDQSGLIFTDREWVQYRIQAGASVTRYRREWLVGKVEFADGKLVGRIGFRGAEGTAEVWSEEERDFLPVAVPQGQAVPFVIDLDTLRLAVQTRGSDIKVMALAGAFQALLSDGGFRWQVRSTKKPMSYAEWRRTVDKVTSIRFKVRRPNPHYRDTPHLEAMLERSESEVVALELQSDEGLNTDFEFIAETQAHIEAGYGEATYRGVSGGHEKVYNTAIQSEETFEEAAVNLDGEVPHESLKALLDQEASPGETG